MRNATATAWGIESLQRGDSCTFQSCADKFGLLFGKGWNKAKEKDGYSVFASGSAAVALPDISNLELSIPAHTVGREQGWLGKVIPAPERFLSDLWPCLNLLGIKDREWEVGTTAHEVAIHYWNELDEWADKNHFHYTIDCATGEYAINLTKSYSSFLQYDLYIAPFEILNDFEFTNYGLCQFIGQGLALLKTIGVEDGDDWVNWYLDNEGGYGYEDDEERQNDFEKNKPLIEFQMVFQNHLTKFSMHTRPRFETYMESEGVDLFWKDWGRKVLSAIDDLGDLSQFADEDEGEDEYGYYEYSMSFAEHFAMGNTEGVVWDFMNDMFSDKINNDGFYDPTVHITLSKNSLKEAEYSLRVVSETGEKLYNLCAVICDLYDN